MFRLFLVCLIALCAVPCFANPSADDFLAVAQASHPAPAPTPAPAPYPPPAPPVVAPSKPVQGPVQAGSCNGQMQNNQSGPGVFGGPGVPGFRWIGNGVQRRQNRRANRGGLFGGVFRGC